MQGEEARKKGSLQGRNRAGRTHARNEAQMTKYGRWASGVRQAVYHRRVSSGHECVARQRTLALACGAQAREQQPVDSLNAGDASSAAYAGV